MYKKVLLLASVLVVLGCSQKKEGCGLQDKSDFEQLFTRDEVYHTALNNTQKAQLMASFETKALLTATYLNPVFEHRSCRKRFKNELKNGEYFFVGVYITNSEKHEFNTKGYSLRLDGLEPLEVKKLDKNDPLRYEMPMVDNWSTYYKVKFKKTNKNNFHLIFENDRFGRDILTYSKGEKPLFESLTDLNREQN